MTWAADVALFAHARAPVPKPRRVSWPELCALLTTFPPPPGADTPKLDLPMWAPVRFHTPRRLAANAETVSCLVLDFDKGITPDEAREPWLSWPHVLHTSYSHTPEAPKFRLVVPLETPVPAAAWRRVWEWGTERVGQRNDLQCKDVSRGYFLPVDRGPHWAIVYDEPSFMLDLNPESLPAPVTREVKLPPPPVTAAVVRPDRRDDLLRWTLASDAASRELVAADLGCSVRDALPGRIARGAKCPRCGMLDVWFFIDPSKPRNARCPHVSCEWTGDLLRLKRGEP